MADMQVSQLNVDLLQDQASISLTKHVPLKNGKGEFFTVVVSTPVGLEGGQSDTSIKQSAIEQAKKVLREALSTLEHHQAR